VELEVSKRTGIVMFFGGLLLTLALLGHAVTPYARSGEPLLLSPSNLAMLNYLRLSKQWLVQFQSLDHQLSAILADDTSDIYRLGRQAQQASRQTHDLAQTIRREPPPAALLALQQSLQNVADNYDHAAQLVLLYVGAPDPQSQRQAFDALSAAQASFRQATERQELLWTAQ
jgi:hypothetical protein